MTNYHARLQASASHEPATSATRPIPARATSSQPDPATAIAFAVTDLQEAEAAYQVVSEGTEPWQLIASTDDASTYDQAVDCLAERVREARRYLASVTR